jgi:hypothetical protein
MASEKKADFWRKHSESWEQSSLPQKTYCQQNNLTMASFRYWRTRLKRSTPDKKLIPVTLSICASTVNLYFPTGLRLEVPTPALAEVLPLVHRFLQDQN